MNATAKEPRAPTCGEAASPTRATREALLEVMPCSLEVRELAMCRAAYIARAAEVQLRRRARCEWLQSKGASRATENSAAPNARIEEQENESGVMKLNRFE